MNLSLTLDDSMALHGCSSVSRAARSSQSSIGASDPSSPKDVYLPPQEPDRTHALSFYVTCDSCAVVLWVRAVCSDCFSLLRALHKSPPNELDRHAPSERGLLGHPSQCSQLWPVKTISVVAIRRMSHHHVSAFGASPGHHCQRCQPFTVQIPFFTTNAWHCPRNLHRKTSRDDHPASSQSVLAFGHRRVS